MRHEAIRSKYPQVVIIDDTMGCLDKDGNLVVVDEQLIQSEVDRLTAEAQLLGYQQKRAAEYPDFRIYLDGVVKGDQAQIQAYIDTCLMIKRKYPKP